MSRFRRAQSSATPSASSGLLGLLGLSGTSDAPGVRALARHGVSPALTAVRLAVVAFAIASPPYFSAHSGTRLHSAVIAAAVGVGAVAWVVFAFGAGRQRLFTWSLVVLGAVGGVLAGLAALSPAIAVGCVVTSTAGARLPPRHSFAITCETVAAFLVTGLVTGAAAETLIGYPFAFVGLWAFGLTRRSFLLRAEQAERTLEQERRAHAAEREAAALEERARIAREIHDVLAHSLAAVSVNLQAAGGLLGGVADSGVADSRPEVAAEIAKAIECVERAGTLTREGLAEARRAIMALRGTASPLPEQLTALISQHAAAGDCAVNLHVTGTARAVSPDASLTAYRVAQESLTNARKHAPGQAVTVSLEFSPDEISVRVVNPVPDPAGADGNGGAGGNGGVSGGGHGLTGMRERAGLSGGTLSAGVHGGQWHVCLRIPALTLPARAPR